MLMYALYKTIIEMIRKKRVTNIFSPMSVSIIPDAKKIIEKR
jgi:hypothetical protein